jgi:uncharacterized membrane protein YeiB
MTTRIIGIDVARAFAVIGMILVNFKMVLGQQGESWLHSFSSLLDGKAAATFVVLAGIGIAFMTNTAYQEKNKVALKKVRIKLLKRATILFILGLSYIIIWSADILHFYGIYILITSFFIRSKPYVSLVVAILFILIYPLLMLLFNYEAGWNFTSFHYTGFLDI